jgi:hypothetical protein
VGGRPGAGRTWLDGVQLRRREALVHLPGLRMRPEGRAILYGPGRYFLCRHCYDLTYQSQRDSQMYRALHRAQDIRRRLGGSANMTEPFPEKPKGMHHDTYERLWWEHHAAEMEQLLGMKEWLDKLEKEVG